MGIGTHEPCRVAPPAGDRVLPVDLVAHAALYGVEFSLTCRLARQALYRAAMGGAEAWPPFQRVLAIAVLRHHPLTLRAFIDAVETLGGREPPVGSPLADSPSILRAYQTLLRTAARAEQGGGSAALSLGQVARACLQLVAHPKVPREEKLTALDLELSLIHFPEVMAERTASQVIDQLCGSFDCEDGLLAAARAGDEALAREFLVRIEEVEHPSHVMHVAAATNAAGVLACLLARAECWPRMGHGAIVVAAARRGCLDALRVLLEHGGAWSSSRDRRILQHALLQAQTEGQDAVRVLISEHLPPHGGRGSRLPLSAMGPGQRRPSF